MSTIQIADGSTLVDNSYSRRHNEAKHDRDFYINAALLSLLIGAHVANYIWDHQVGLTCSISLLSIPAGGAVVAGYTAYESHKIVSAHSPSLIKAVEVFSGIFPIENPENPEISEAFILTTNQLLVDEFEHAVREVFSPPSVPEEGRTSVAILKEAFGMPHRHQLLQSHDVVFGVLRLNEELNENDPNQSKLFFWGNAHQTSLSYRGLPLKHYAPNDVTRFPPQEEDMDPAFSQYEGELGIWRSHLVMLHTTVAYLPNHPNQDFFDEVI